MSFTVSALKPSPVMLYISQSGPPSAPHPHTPFLSVPFSGDLLPHWQLMAVTNVSELPQLSTKRQNPFFLQALWGSRRGWQKGRKPAAMQTSLICNAIWRMPLTWRALLSPVANPTPECLHTLHSGLRGTPSTIHCWEHHAFLIWPPHSVKLSC